MKRISIRGFITSAWMDSSWADGYIAKGLFTPESRVRRELDSTNEDAELYINSPGGSVFDGNEMINAFKQFQARGHKLTITVGSLAASMAANIVALTGVPVRCHKNSKIMYHGASTWTEAGKQGHEDSAALLGRINADVVGALVGTFKLPKAKVDEWFAEGRAGWLNAEEAKACGLVSEIIDEAAEPLAKMSKEEAAPILATGVDIAALADVLDADTPPPPQPPPPDDDPFMVLSAAHETALARITAIEADLTQARASLTTQQAAAAAAATTAQQTAAQQTQQIAALQGRITRLQVAALHLPPEPKSWAEALTLCNGDYDTAARRYPNLKAARMGKA